VREGGAASWLTGWRFQQVQPPWSKRLFWVVGFPALLIWFGLILSGAFPEYQTMAFVVFGALAVVAVIQNFYFFRWLVTGKSNG
jgi:hypothetical protein